jgi:hypothetical protein
MGGTPWRPARLPLACVTPSSGIAKAVLAEFKTLTKHL